MCKTKIRNTPEVPCYWISKIRIDAMPYQFLTTNTYGLELKSARKKPNCCQIKFQSVAKYFYFFCRGFSFILIIKLKSRAGIEAE